MKAYSKVGTPDYIAPEVLFLILGSYQQWVLRNCRLVVSRSYSF
jgi:hypothetical protein